VSLCSFSFFSSPLPFSFTVFILPYVPDGVPPLAFLKPVFSNRSSLNLILPMGKVPMKYHGKRSGGR
jgi:hypothetical protein